jgi:hypothetical protein
MVFDADPDPDPGGGEGVGQPKMCIPPDKILGTPLLDTNCEKISATIFMMRDVSQNNKKLDIFYLLF